MERGLGAPPVSEEYSSTPKHVGCFQPLLQRKQVRSTSSWKLKPVSRIRTETSSPPLQQETGMENLQPRVACSNPRQQGLGKARSETGGTKWHIGIFNCLSFLF